MRSLGDDCPACVPFMACCSMVKVVHPVGLRSNRVSTPHRSRRLGEVAKRFRRLDQWSMLA